FTEDAVAVGTGSDEISFGRNEIRSEMDQDTSQLDELSIAIDAPPNVSIEGDAAFVFASITFNGSARGKSFQIPARWTLGLVSTREEWLIAQLHFSVAD
ncbi:MAG: nuclear transport factor 2 family protein, partial [Acidimicrobiia bacterium]